MSPLYLIIISMIITCITHWVYRWWCPKCNGKIPPGFMGWPLLGETLEFFAPNTTSEISPFIKTRMQRYGPIFRTSLVGKPILVSTDPDLNHLIFLKEGELFQSWYPDSFTEIFGRQNVGSLHGFMYKYLKSMILSLFGPESLKNMLSDVQLSVSKELHLWSTVHHTVDLKDAIATMIFNLTSRKLISHDPEKASENLRENFAEFIKGLISFPLNFPGTAYHKCLKGRKKVMATLKKLLQERRMAPSKHNEDFYDFVIEELSKEDTILTEAIALDLMFLLLFASYETTSLALTLAMKFLTDHPLVLQTLTEEHEAILRRRDNVDSGVTWKEYKSMTFTFQIINETLRLANIAPLMFRKALKDINFKGYTIPKGWRVMVCPPAIHLNPSVYEDPLQFNPWRWKGGNINGATRNFMAFGGGMRFCIGADFAKVQMAVFLHCLVTNYRWQAIKGGNIVRTPGLSFPDGFHVRIFKRKTEEDVIKFD
ncbi:hypothetical protein V2J09_014693 [Rumex salicifolius]